MAKDIIQDHLTKYSEDDTTLEMAQKRLESTEEIETKSFLGSLTDTSSLISHGMSLGALLLGQPGAAAYLSGIDLLKSPGEVARSKQGKAQAVSRAAEGVIAAKDEETKATAKLTAEETLATAKVDAAKLTAEAKVDAEELKVDSEADAKAILAKAAKSDRLIQEIGDNPEFWAELFQVSNMTNSQISNLLDLPTAVKWDTFNDERKDQAQIDLLIGETVAAMKETDNATVLKALGADLLKLSTPGAVWKDGELGGVAERAALGNLTFDEIIGGVDEKMTGASLKNARAAAAGGKSQLEVIDELEARPDQLSRDKERADGDLRIIEDLMALMDEGSTYDTKTEVWINKRVVSEAIPLLPKEDQARAFLMADTWGFIGTLEGQQDQFDAILVKTKMAYADISLKYAHLDDFPNKYPPTWPYTQAREIVQDSRVFGEKAAAHGAAAKVTVLADAITAVGYAPGTRGAVAIQRKARANAKASLGPGEHPLPAILAKAHQLIAANPMKYASIGEEALEFVGVLAPDADTTATPIVE